MAPMDRYGTQDMRSLGDGRSLARAGRGNDAGGAKERLETAPEPSPATAVEGCAGQETLWHAQLELEHPT